MLHRTVVVRMVDIRAEDTGLHMVAANRKAVPAELLSLETAAETQIRTEVRVVDIADMADHSVRSSFEHFLNRHCRRIVGHNVASELDSLDSLQSHMRRRYLRARCTDLAGTRRVVHLACTPLQALLGVDSVSLLPLLKSCVLAVLMSSRLTDACKARENKDCLIYVPACCLPHACPAEVRHSLTLIACTAVFTFQYPRSDWKF